MLDVGSVRLGNIMEIVRNYGTQKEFCEASGVAPSQLSQFLMEPRSNGFRRPGEKFCRKLEERLGLPAMSLDRPRPDQTLTKDGADFDLSGLTSLQLATIEQLAKAMRKKVVGDAMCVDILGKCTTLLDQA